MDCLHENNQKKQMNSLLTTYNLKHAVNFATTIQNDSSTAFENMFDKSTSFSSSSTSTIINGLPDHDAQNLIIKSIATADNLISFKQTNK
jgi:hypothetical protein